MNKMLQNIEKYSRLITKFTDPKKYSSLLHNKQYTYQQKQYSQNFSDGSQKSNESAKDYCNDKQNKWRYNWYSSSNGIKIFSGLATAGAIFTLNSALCDSAKEEELISVDNEKDLDSCTNFKAYPPKDNAINYARNLLSAKMVESGSPGLVIAVTVNGKTVYSEGMGYADVENRVPCSPKTVLRIASISKSITAAAVAKLWEEGKLDLDAPVQKYVPTFPVKTYDGKEVSITTRQVCSHMSGIRHYKIKDPNKKDELIIIGTHINPPENIEDDDKVLKENNEPSKEKGDNKSEVLKNNTKSSEEIGDTELDKHSLVDDNSNKKEIPIQKVEIIVNKDDTDNKKDYKSPGNKEDDKVVNENNETNQDIEDTILDEKSQEDSKSSQKDDVVKGKRKNLRRLLNKNGFRAVHGKQQKEPKEEDEFDLKEYYIKEHFETVEEALKLFQDDELFFEPGQGYKYTTYGWTLVSAVVEGAAGKSFTKVISKLFHDLGLENTFLDKNKPIIYNRGKSYVRDKKTSKMINAPYVDNSYKWAGGGFLSTVGDLTKFGNAMLYANQYKESDTHDPKSPPGYLKSSTMKELWSPVSGSKMDWDQDGYYGLGWGVVPEQYKYGCGRKVRHYLSHTGGAVGASSVLLVMPEQELECEEGTHQGSLPQGVVVAIIANMGSVGLNKVALQIARTFEGAHKDKQNKNKFNYKTYDI